MDEKEENSVEDKRFMKLASESIELKDGHYVIGLPFKQNSVDMPNNRIQAEQRVAMLKRKFERDVAYRDEYTAFMDNILDKSFAKKVPEDQLHQDCDGKVWYLPHHGVFHPTKKKLRVVFDCLARYRGTSLNDQLLDKQFSWHTLEISTG